MKGGISMSGSGSKESSWLDRIAQLLAHQRQSPSSPRRKLLAERLERRTVLSGTPLAVEETAAGPSLEEYLAQGHAMGPVMPGEVAPTSAGESDTMPESSLSASDSPVLTAQYFYSYVGQGAGEGEGEGSGSGSGSGAGSGSGSAASSGSGSGGGEGSGSGEGSGGGESSSSGGNQAPIIEGFWIEYQGDNIVLHGLVANDGGFNGLTVTFGDLINATITPNQDGQFALTMARPIDEGMIRITATDAGGLTSEAVFAEYYN